MSLDPFCFGKWQAVPCILQRACLPGIANSYWMLTIYQAVLEHVTCFILLLPFPYNSEIDTSITIPFYNWENWGTERLHRIASVILPVRPIWPLCKHCLWHNPHFHLGSLKNSLNSLKRWHVSWWGLGGGENGTASALPWALLCAYLRCVLCMRKELIFSSLELGHVVNNGVWQVFSGSEKLPLGFLLESNITQWLIVWTLEIDTSDLYLGSDFS